MYLAMNRFRVALGQDEAFEEVWRSRDSQLRTVPGFRTFHLMRGPQREDHVLYASHTVWDSYEAFEEWTRSEAFRAAHRGAGGNRGMYLGPPEFEGFSPVQSVTRD